MTLPKKVLIAVTSYSEVFYSDGKRTGLFYTEALHPFIQFTRAGFEVDLASETGDYGIDDHSTTTQFMTHTDMTCLNDPNYALNKKLNSMKKASALNPKDYGIFFASAGHGTLFDYPTAKGLQHIAEDVWSRGGIVSAVCHGPMILPAVKDSKTGKSIINGKQITGFTTLGEEQMGVLGIMQKHKLTTIEDAAASAGATFISPKSPFEDFHITDGRIVTGVNPASAQSTADAAIQAFKAL